MKKTLLTLAGLAAVDALLVEPNWLQITQIDLSRLGVGKTIVHLTDIHYRGNRAWLERIIETARKEKPDIVCFTGDLVDNQNTRHLGGALELLGKIGCPVYGVSGNHDPEDPGSIRMLNEGTAATGGAWLADSPADQGGFILHGAQRIQGLGQIETKPKILLCHYPAVGHWLETQPYDLILSGHSHGGQCRIPFFGPVIVPDRVGGYVAGHYETPAGHLFVSRGLGTSVLPLRFACRPEMAVIRI